jgi:hypothetical protein
VEAQIQSGQLVELFSERNTGGYYIVTRPGPQRAPVRLSSDGLSAKRRSLKRINNYAIGITLVDNSGPNPICALVT